MDPMKQNPTASTAAKLLRISREQVFKLIRQGKLRRGPVAKINHRWHTTVMIDAKFNTQREARGLKPIFPQSNFDGEAERLERLVARAEASADYVMTSSVEEKCRNAMNICLEAKKACDKDM